VSAIALVLDHPVSQAVAWALLRFLWQGTLGAAALAGIFRLGRRWTANTRYRIGCVALAVFLVLPVATAVDLSRPSPSLGPQASPHEPQMASTLAGDLAPIRMAVGNLVRPTLPWIVLVWLGGVAAFLVQGIAAGASMSRIRVRGERPDSAFQARLDQLTARTGLQRRVALRTCSAAQSPGVIGWRRPLILIPPSLPIRLTPAQLELILTHELAHVRRNDYLVNVLQSVVEALLFFHPAVWWVSDRVRIEREHACDRLTVELVGDALGYARALTDVACWATRPSGEPGLAFVGPASTTLMERVDRILDQPTPLRGANLPSARTLITLAVLASAGLVSQAAIAQPGSGEARANAPLELHRLDEANEGTEAIEEMEAFEALEADEPVPAHSRPT
jgi:beta-lactamase regulating signal transducer with metallopeptidase domain